MRPWRVITALAILLIGAAGATGAAIEREPGWATLFVALWLAGAVLMLGELQRGTRP